MQISVIDSRIYVSLSRRNLEHLLQMLDMQTGIRELRRKTENGLQLYVSADENDQHYLGRVPGPGVPERYASLGTDLGRDAIRFSKKETEA